MKGKSGWVWRTAKILQCLLELGWRKIEENTLMKVKDLIEKTKDGSIQMIVIYTNESDLKSVGILEDYSISNYEHDGYVNTVVLMTRWKIAFLLETNQIQK